MITQSTISRSSPRRFTCMPKRGTAAYTRIRICTSICRSLEASCADRGVQGVCKGVHGAPQNPHRRLRALLRLRAGLRLRKQGKTAKSSIARFSSFLPLSFFIYICVLEPVIPRYVAHARAVLVWVGGQGLGARRGQGRDHAARQAGGPRRPQGDHARQGVCVRMQMCMRAHAGAVGPCACGREDI